ncbi:hypothetical protein BH23BAC3_BH23BAC3_32980 [soil metagenome]
MGLVSPSMFGYRWMEKETVHEYMARKNKSVSDLSYETIHKEESAKNPLPCNIQDRDELSDDQGWWGYSLRDVPSRTSRETFMATIPDCKVVPCIDDDKEFWITILNEDERSLELDQISFRPWHAEVLNSSRTADKTDKATWFLERVYHNHSHWLTAHVPKLILLKERNQLENIIMPPKDKRTAVINSTFKMLGINPDEFRTLDSTRPLEVKELTVMETDRFRPELLRSVREALCPAAAEKPHRRIYISRAKAQRRKFLNEKDIWPILERLGFELVFMEEMSFSAQIEVMQQAEIVVALRGAAITNVLFCSPGTHVVEIADLSFPNPNFYALCSAMGHHYWILDAEGVGDVHPLEKDLRIDPVEVEKTIHKILKF